jgi:O-antigen/teichoic acid export membrane protein
VLTVAGMAVLLPGAGLILGVFGSSYAASATTSLQLLAIAGLPTIVKGHYVAVCRIRGETNEAIVIVTLGAVLEIGLAAAGTQVDGLTGLSAGWLIAVSIQAMMMGPKVVRAARPSQPPIAVDRSSA